uniref:hypothetical protein n=1 Tax=Cellvibrio fontiphilus TaxID=1815559 RepID=UPI002B4BD150|nr:hypothetical protein [Cellvibrio fontiphilus]
MSKKSDDILKQFEVLNGTDDEPQKEHSLQENAKERALHPEHLNVGTAFDWEEMEAYKQELERMDREGVGLSHPAKK